MKKLISFLITLFFLSAFAITNPPKKTTIIKTTDSKITKVVVAPIVSAAAIKFEKSNATEDIAVDGKDVLISGSNNKLTITGVVDKILISGKNNDITIIAVNEIVITGSGNFVSWEKTNNENTKPIIQDKGGYNNVGKKAGNAMTKEDD